MTMKVSLPGLAVGGFIAVILLKSFIPSFSLEGMTGGIPIWLTPIILIVAVVLIFGLIGHWRAKEAKGPMLAVTIIAVVSFVLIGLVVVFGTDAVERGFQDTREIGDSFANRVPGQNVTTAPTAAQITAQRLAVINPQRTVRLVRCTSDPNTGWSEEVPVDPRLHFQFVQDVRGQYLSGRWHEIVGANIPDLVSKLRFCTSRAEFVGTDLYITWTPR